MIPSVPLVTDSAYKFAALFGLIVMISSLVVQIYVFKIHYEFAASINDEFELLKLKSDLSPAESIRKHALEKMLEIRSLLSKMSG